MSPRDCVDSPAGGTWRGVEFHSSRTSLMGRSNKSLFRAGRGRSVSRRAQLVWAALVGAMTVVGGGLFLMDRGLPTASGDSLTLTPLMATASPDTVEVVFNTPAPLDKSRWLSIVIHDSGSPVGNPASLDAQAR